jgi:xanthine dehydrogenase accessory factor
MLAELDAGRPCALCAVVATRGSAPQTPGAALLLRADMSTLGTLGGGCVEAEAIRRAYETLAGGAPRLLEFTLDHDYGWDDGLICGGGMEIAVAPLTPQSDLTPYREALARARRRAPAAFPLRVQREGRWLEYRIALETPPTLLIAGAGHVGQALARLAAGLDFHVVVFDDRADYAAPERFPAGTQLIAGDIACALRAWLIGPACYVVIVTRGHRHDHQALDAAIGSPAGYIGLIGSRRKSRMILEDLAAHGAAPEILARVHTPIGLPIGAATVAEIAVSIAAELIQERRKTTPRLVEGPLEG